MTRRPSAGTAAPRYARPFVGIFVTTLVLSALAGWNIWPFSNWELFSRLRTDQASGWQAVAIDRSGRGRVDPIASLPQGYRGFPNIMDAFPEWPATQRNAICAVWLRRAREEFGPSTRALRIYHLDWLLSDRRGSRAAPPHRKLTWTCGRRGARAVG